MSDDLGPLSPCETAPQAKAYQRHFEVGVPKGALTWSSNAQRSKRLIAWRLAVMTKFSDSARVLRVGWFLEGLFLKEGYAYAGDSYISETLGIQVNNVQSALTTLDKAGAIIRASIFVNRMPQRRIWPSTKIIPLTTRGMDTPHHDAWDTPHRKGTDSERTTHTVKATRISSTATAAMQDAERRARLLSQPQH